jgi:hypothetical protein
MFDDCCTIGARSHARGEVTMAIGVQPDFEGATVEQCDEIIRNMASPPEGMADRAAGFTGDTDGEGPARHRCLESPETFEKFAEKEKIGPISREVGVAAPPAIQVFEVDNDLTAG